MSRPYLELGAAVPSSGAEGINQNSNEGRVDARRASEVSLVLVIVIVRVRRACLSCRRQRNGFCKIVRPLLFNVYIL